MKMVYTWFFLSCKRYLKKPGILLVLLLLPVTAWLVGKYVPKEKEGINIALYLQDTTDKYESKESNLKENWKNMGIRLVEELSDSGTADHRTDSQNLFHFYLCDSEEELKNQVILGEAECGYVIPEDLGERLRDKRIKDVMMLYTSPSTVTGPISTETVFAALSRLYDRQMLVDYVQDEKAGDLYDVWYAEGNIFHFEYVYEESGQIGENFKKNQGNSDASSTSVFPVKGITAVLIFTMSLYSACILEEDEKKGLFATLYPAEKRRCQAAMFLALPVFVFFSGVLSFLTGGILKGEMAETVGQITGLFLYSAASCVYAWILKYITGSGKVLFCLIPFFIVGSLIFTPVFADMGRFVPFIQWIGRIFLPYYYL